MSAPHADVENGGDFVVPLTDLAAVHTDKVILDVHTLDAKRRHAIEHAHDTEVPRIVDRPK